MNEADRQWSLWAYRSARECVSEVSTPPCERGCLDAHAEDMHQRPANSRSPQTPTTDEHAIERVPVNKLERSNGFRDHVVSPKDSAATSVRRLGEGISKQNDVDTSPKNAGSVEPEMTVSAFVRLVNASGFGEVLTERQLLRQRRAFPSIDAGRGKVNVMAYLASICSRRRRTRRDGELSVSDLGEMLEQQRYLCALTGERLTPENLALDHIVPISEGGSFAVENSQLVTKAANRAKHTMTQADFIQLCGQVAAKSNIAD